jgi:preprotein translocase subunit SecG
MQVFLNVSQILVSILIVITILLQVKGQGGGLFGGSDTSFRTRRGLEKTLFQFTIVLVVAFIGVSLASVKLA